MEETFRGLDASLNIGCCDLHIRSRGPRIEIYTRTLCKAYGVGPDTCLSDPSVQASVARLITVLATSSGLLATLTTAWWGALSDLHGRTRVLGFNVAGLLVSDVSFLLVAQFWERLPGGYWLFVVGPIAEGLVGGISVASVVMHAYISDCSPSGSRSCAFSLLMGLLFCGMSIGPLLSGLIMKTSHRLLPVFYMTTALDAAVSLMVWFILPESLSSTRMHESRRKHAEEQEPTSSTVFGVLKKLQRTFSFFTPLLVLLPQKVGELAASVYQQLQYAAMTYSWTSENISYWMGGVGVAKAFYLTLVFPAILKVLSKLRAAPVPLPATESEPVQLPDPSNELELPASAPSFEKAPHPASLDLILARVAIINDIICYALMPVAATGTLFAAISVCSSMGTSFGPVMNSLALELYSRRGGTDSGRLLGALTVVSALSSHIIGPALFGLTYMKTVATLPGAIYILCCAALVTSLLLLLLIRLHREKYEHENEVDEHADAYESDTTSMTGSNYAAVSCTYILEPSEPSTFCHVVRVKSKVITGSVQFDEAVMSKSGDQLTLPGGRRGATSRSRPGSRPRASRNHSTSSVPYLPQGPEDLIIPDAPIGEGAAELLQEFVHPHHHESEDTLIVDHGDDGPGDEEEGQTSDAEWRQSLPWWKRPAPWWFLAFVPFATIAMSATVAPKIEIYTKLACEVHKPEYTIGRDAIEIGFSTLMSYATNSSTVFPLDDQSQRLCVLGCVTTGWWGSLSDRYGRTTILGLSLIGTLVTDFNFIFVYKFSKMLPGGYWFLVCGPIIEGFLGGMSATSAAIHAYIADCTEPGSRSRVFSLFLGVVFTGMGLGPTLGGLLIRFSGNILSVFYGAAGIHVLYAILIWIFVPESLSPLSMTESRKRHVADIEAYRRANTNGGAVVLLKKVFGFLSPLNLFFPNVINDGRNPVKHAQRD
ncbi:putative membrane protein C14C4.07 [Grifola frondosa]|uniref:Putative membrane protein C14C4.07 n=1 Tax=Grifola frondosa TaxID=5627 RepID=A0A1C7LYN5_GRIFR|nr:putative membrane protein C14C4.07 [Grifola frondosa]